jgi:hypothetical protein
MIRAMETSPLSKILDEPRLGYVKEHGKRKWKAGTPVRWYWRRGDER